MSSESGSDNPKSIFLVPHPKIVFLYPSFIMALAAGIFSVVTKDPQGTWAHNVSLMFLAILGVNLMVITFDFPRTTSLTIAFAGLTVFLGLLLAFREFPDWWPRVAEILRALKPSANATFYFLFTSILAALYLAVLVVVQFDYWEVRPNELLHHHGLLSDLERFPAPNLRIDKEINDLLEYALLRSGRLVLHPSAERRAIVLENVFFINKKEAQITKMLSRLQVELKTEEK
jgi:hypothetical protein